MPTNLNPIYSGSGDVQASAVMAAVASVLYNGSGTIATDVHKIWQASADGGYIQRVRFKYVANATTSSIACVARLFISSAVSGAVTDANSWFYEDIALPATAALTTTSGNISPEIALNLALPAAYTILCKLTVAQPASCGWIATGFGGKYTTPA